MLPPGVEGLGWEQGMAGHTVSAVRKQQVMNPGAKLVSSFPPFINCGTPA